MLKYEDEVKILFEPVKMKNCTIKNRFMRSAMESQMGRSDGSVTEDHIRHYVTGASGGVGLMVIEGIGVHPAGKFLGEQITAYDDECIPGLTRLADEIHAHGNGVTVWAQLHCGGKVNFGYSYGQNDNGIDLNDFTEEMILDIIRGYGDAALRLKKAGFDGVQLHGAHGYLPAQFTSPSVNKRTDKWGGSVENRARFGTEIIRRVRMMCGDDFPVGVKMNTADFLPGGHFLEETAQIAKMYADAGVCQIEMSGGMGMMIELRENFRRKLGDNRCYFREAIPAFKKALEGTGVSLAICGGTGDPEEMVEMVREGVDMVSFGRPWLTEYDFADRIQAGDYRATRCVSREKLCNLCLKRLGLGPVTCYKFYPGYCRMTCPIDQDSPEYIARIAREDFEGAVDIIRKDSPLPNILCRICTHKCETACRGNDGESLAIRDLKRFAMDYSREHQYRLTAETGKKSESRGKIAVVGSGPAGLACAWALAGMGYTPDIFEKENIAGGAPATAVPKYRLPSDALEADIDYIRSMGVTIYTGRALGRDFSISDLFDRGYQAVFLGLGVGAGAALSVPGSDKQGVLIGLDFLKAVKRGNAPEVGKKVIVIGGGSVAVDVAATAVRLGAEEVRMVCLETRENMPAGYEDLKEAEEEGVMVADGWGIESVTGSEKADGVNLIRCVSVFDENGAFHPVYDETAREHLEADTIISAIGQKADLSCLNGEEAKKLVDGGRIDADELTCETGYAGVFAGGDAVTGIKDVVTAAQAGKEAAESIDRYLRGVSQERPPKAERYGQFWKPDCINKPTETMIKPEEEGSSRRRAQMVAPEIRKTNFEEISMTLTKEQAVSEARRCLKYDLNLEAESEERLANAGIATPLLDKRLTGEEW